MAPNEYKSIVKNYITTTLNIYSTTLTKLAGFASKFAESVKEEYTHHEETKTRQKSQDQEKVGKKLGDKK